MPSYWIRPRVDRPGDPPAALPNALDFSETFYGMFCGATAFFDPYRDLFDQICAVANVSFSDIRDMCICGALWSEELADLAETAKQPLVAVHDRFGELYRALAATDGWVARLDLPYDEDRDYFEGFYETRREQTLEELDYDDDRYEHPDNLACTFGNELRQLLGYLADARKLGYERFWFEGR